MEQRYSSCLTFNFLDLKFEIEILLPAGHSQPGLEEGAEDASRRKSILEAKKTLSK
jgi:hypothetical protein